MKLGRPRQNPIPSLDGVRGLACLIVLFSHGGHIRLLPTPGYTAYGEPGIVLFFALSGFLMHYHYFRFARLSWRFAASFLVRRFFRIYPAYAIILVLYCVSQQFAFVPRQDVTFSTLNDFLLLRHVRGHFWTIPAEVKFYLLFPFICYALLLTPLNRHWKLSIIAAAWVMLCLANFPPHTTDLLGNLKFFLVGLAAAYAYISYPIKGWLSPEQWNALLFAYIAVGGLLLHVAYNAHLLNYASPAVDAYLSVLAAVVILAASNATGWAAYLFTNPLMRFCGTISYSVYLVHILVYRVCIHNIHASPLKLSLITYGSLTLVGVLLYVLIEKPFNDLGHRLSLRIMPR